MILSLGMARGRTSGVAFGLGCALGCLNHTLLAVLGISALIAASARVRRPGLRIAGGLFYLIWLGIQAIRMARAAGVPDVGGAPAETPGKLFLKGLVANAVDPKVILYFPRRSCRSSSTASAATSPGRLRNSVYSSPPTLRMFGAVGWFAGNLGERLARRPAIGAWLDRIAGGIFVALGLRLLAIR